MIEVEPTIREQFERGIPYYGYDSTTPKPELAFLAQEAVEACLEAHSALYEERFPVVAFSDENSGEDDKYVSFADSFGNPLYTNWDPTHPSTDIGIRGLNPDFRGPANQTTVIHSDGYAAEEFARGGAPYVAIDALHAVGNLNRFVTEHIVRQMLTDLALAYDQEPSEYIEKFIPRDMRPRILTRAILNHAVVSELVGGDGRPLRMKEHRDQSSFTVDTFQTGPGLEYLEEGIWKSARGRISCFPGQADDCLEGRSRGAIHRVVRDCGVLPTSQMLDADIDRIAFPTFVMASGLHSRVIRPNSQDTHPDVRAQELLAA